MAMKPSRYQFLFNKTDETYVTLDAMYRHVFNDRGNNKCG
jgi:hypothetical protein